MKEIVCWVKIHCVFSQYSCAMHPDVLQQAGHYHIEIPDGHQAMGSVSLFTEHLRSAAVCKILSNALFGPAWYDRCLFLVWEPVRLKTKHWMLRLGYNTPYPPRLLWIAVDYFRVHFRLISPGLYHRTN